MARMLSQVATIIRGSVGGLTYLSNQYHQIVMRARTAPVQPVSIYRTAIKAAFAFAQGLWDGATQSDRDRWQTYAANTPYTGPLGQYSITGRQMFMASHALALYMNDIYSAGMATATTPPVVNGFLALGSITLNAPGAAGTGFNVSIVNILGNGDATALVEISPPFTQTRNQYKGPWLPAQSIIIPCTAGASGQADLVGLVSGSVYFLKIRLLRDLAPIRFSTTQIVRGIAATTV